MSKLSWVMTEHVGQSGWVQCRFIQTRYPYLTLAEIEFHAPIYSVEITRHVKGYVDYQLNGTPEFRTLEDAKTWAQAVVLLS